MKKYEMSEDQLNNIMEACKPVVQIALQCGQPPSPQANANAAWEARGKEMGFIWDTVRPGDGDRFFYAEEIKAKQTEG